MNRYFILHILLLKIAGLVALYSVLFSQTSCQPLEDNRSSDPQLEEITISATKWTDKLELFVEFRPFVTGEPTRFAAHFTNLKNYKPISDAVVSVKLIGKTKVSDSVDSALRPGIFAPTIVPDQPGIYSLNFEITFEDINEVVELGEFEVFRTRQEAEEESISLVEGEITYLKEQAWKTDFSIIEVLKRNFNERVLVSGEIEFNTSQYSTVSTPAAGMLVLRKELLPGKYIRKGELLGTVVSKDIIAGVAAEENLHLEFLRHKSRYNQAKSNFQRQKQLFDGEVISESEFEQDKLTFEIAEAEYNTIADSYIESEGGIELTARTSGYIKKVLSQSGDYMEVGRPVIEINPQKTSLLKIDVPVAYFNRIDQIDSVRWKSGGHWVSSSSKVITRARQIEDGNVYFPLWLEISSNTITPGHFLQAELVMSSTSKSRIMVPTTAMLEDFGIYYLIVQVTGESFEKREVKIGDRNSEWIEITSGIEEREIVVVQGAYQVKMAGMAGEAPAHGHEH